MPCEQSLVYSPHFRSRSWHLEDILRDAFPVQQNISKLPYLKIAIMDAGRSWILEIARTLQNCELFKVFLIAMYGCTMSSLTNGLLIDEAFQPSTWFPEPLIT